MMTKVMLLLPFLVVLVNGQCSAGRTDHARCSVWVTAGFCNQTFYSTMQKQLYCGTACNLCPVTTCGAIYRGTAVTIQNVQVTTDTATPIPTGNAITGVYTIPGCTMNLYTDTAGTTAATGSPFTGTGAIVTPSGTATTAAAMKCTCP